MTDIGAAMAWTLAISAVCTMITTCTYAYFAHERKMVKLSHQHEMSKKADEAAQQHMLSPEVIAMRTAEAEVKKSICSICAAKIRYF